ncbi:MAG: DJ-1/PfpI family protein [Chloroflexota bacterium]
MNKHPPDVMVLWGENFDEQMATTFVTQFREAGFHVKLVGLRGRQMTGMRGLALMPDMTLSQALPLASMVRCVVLPCHSPYLTQLDNDPRIQDFFQDANDNEAQVVTGQIHVAELEKLTNPVRVMSYVGGVGADESVGQVKQKLSAAASVHATTIPIA